MNSIKHRFTLDMHSTQSQISIPASLYDTARTLYVNFTDGGNPYHILEGCTALLIISKPSGAKLYEWCAIKDNTNVVYPFSQNKNTASEEGICDCEITLYSAPDEDGDIEQIASPRFVIVVSERAINRDDEEVLPEASIGIIDSIVKAENERSKTFQASEEARTKTFQASEAARTEAFNASEAGREAAETARATAEEQRKATFNSWGNTLDKHELGVPLASYIKANIVPQSYIHTGYNNYGNTGHIVTGAIDDNVTFTTSAPLKIAVGTKYLALDKYGVNNPYVYAVGFYSALPCSESTFISGFDTSAMTKATPTTLDVPDGTNYIVFSMMNGVIPSAFLSNEKQITLGAEVEALGAEVEALGAEVVKTNAQTLTEEQKTQARENIGMFDFDIVEVSDNNLFDKSKAITGAWWESATQAEPKTNQYTGSYVACSANIGEVKTITFLLSGTNYAGTLYNIFAIDSNGNAIETILVDKIVANPDNLVTVTLPDNTHKIRFNINGIAGYFETYKLMVNEGTEALPYEDYISEKKIEIPGLDYTDAEMQKEINEIKEKVDTLSKSDVYGRITLGKKIYAVVSDTMQMFFDSIIEGDISNMVVKLLCAKGRNFPRYYEVTPTSSDVGSYEMTITLYDFNGNVIDSATTTLEIVEAINPTSAVNVLCVGDSTMEQGQIPIEASRRIKGTAGNTTTPVSLALNNYNFVGRKKNSANNVGWEGTGGWYFGSYNSAGYAAVRVGVTDAENVNIGDIYTVNGYQLQIAEINVTGGVGNIRFLFYFTTPYNSAFDSTPTSGTLTRSSGSGQDGISYTDLTVEKYQPFWNNETNAFDISTYANAYCNGQIDIICVLLGVNNLISGEAFKDVSDIVADAKTFFRNVHSQLPNCKIIASTVPLASVNGGIAANYTTSATSGAYSANGLNHKIRTYNAALIALEVDEEFSPYVIVSNSHAQFDAVNGYPTTTKALNTRVTATETLQSNGVHPNNAGYWQLSDALAFRAVIGNS